jgi:hypothetical protein
MEDIRKELQTQEKREEDRQACERQEQEERKHKQNKYSNTTAFLVEFKLRLAILKSYNS